MATIEATGENFEKLVAEHPFLIVDFWAPWCAPCRAFGPVFEQASEEHPEIAFAKVNTEQETTLAAHFQIRSIPTLMIMRDRIVVYSQPGSLPQSALKELLTKAAALDMDEVRREVEAGSKSAEA